MEMYYKKLTANIPKQYLTTSNANSNLQFVYTAMHGVGYDYVVKGFEVSNLKPVIPVVEQRDANPEFPTVKFPNPEEGASSLDMSMKLAEKIGSNLILANDPDADRLACAERDAMYIFYFDDLCFSFINFSILIFNIIFEI